MRVITGSARGRRLRTPDGKDIRPTTDKVKEAVFSIIQFDIEGAAVLDLFSGSGQLGIEALSRGAKNCVFVDIIHLWATERRPGSWKFLSDFWIYSKYFQLTNTRC